MDSVSQLVLGSAVGYSALGTKIGRKALIVGAVLGTLPDLDVFINFGGAVENFVYHRGFSHSLLIHALVSPLFAWLVCRMAWAQKASFRRWTTAIFLVFSTHAILDSMTVYGTQLLWPISTYPFSFSNLFIIDPLYTLPLLVSVMIVSFIKDTSKRGQLINGFLLCLSSLYACWGLAVKSYIDEQIMHRIDSEGIEILAYESTPSPFNTLLWRGVATTLDGHYEIYASVFDEVDEISLYFYENQRALLDAVPQDKRINQLMAFTKGLYGIYQKDDDVYFSDLRMGVEGFYVFTFVVAQQQGIEYNKGSFEQLSSRPQLRQARLFFDRIFDPRVDLSFK